MRHAVLILALLSLVGCGPSLRHEPLIEAGRSTTIEVRVPSDKAPASSGTVYYQLPGQPAYTGVALQRRGDLLFATLPTADLPIGAEIRYYLDVDTGDKAHALGSPGSPYVTRIVTREDLVFHALDADVNYRHTGDPITFRLDADGHPIEWAKVVYLSPAAPGETIVAMRPVGADRAECRIDTDRDDDGYWRYHVDVFIQGTHYRLPAAGWESFRLHEARD